MVDLSKVMQREHLHSEHAAQCWLDARRSDRQRERSNKMDFTKGREPGQWWPWQFPDRMSATLYCPDCGKQLGLQNHTIAANGEVTPSVSTPKDFVEHKECGFHANVRLIGWKEMLTEERKDE